jgi:hypothetical protein
VLYCYFYGNIDLLISFKNKGEVLQCFQLQKLENTAINNDKNLFKLFVLGKNGIAYFCLLNGKLLFILKTKNTMNSKGEPCCIADISNNKFEIVIY